LIFLSISTFIQSLLPEEEYESKIYTYRAHFHIAHPDLNLRRNIPLEYGENSPPADMTVL
jgi:hypothetical protein